MKILAIRGENLASLEGEFEIDFTQEPLRSAGIFAITGSTGAGKSTLLDTLCLALFEKIPRNRNIAKGIKIEDVKGNEIAQQDSRTILRRGTSSGYAEVDFISLGGETFRARWSVRRSYGKVEGSLQDAVYQVKNLTTGLDQGGTKTELLSQVTDLIGLNFDQFTRAVLLAQGDFSTFLKAGPNEKAELLEKLTGTGIYSRISTSIFAKEKEARMALEVIREKIKGLELWSEEEMAAFVQEKGTLGEQLLVLEKRKGLLESKLEWLNENRNRLSDVKLAEALLTEAQRAVDVAKPRAAFLERIDKVQEIRADYSSWMVATKQLQENQARCAQRLEEVAAEGKALVLIEEKWTAYELQQRGFQEELEKTAPLLKLARALDVRIAEQGKQLDAVKVSVDTAAKGMADTERLMGITRQSIAQGKKRMEDIRLWFKEHLVYEKAVANASLVANLMLSASDKLTNGKQLAAVLSKEEAALIEDKRLLEAKVLEADELNKLLPEEVLILRKELVEGQPCPVCGNTHHLLTEVHEANALKEEALNLAKKKVAARVVTLTKEVEVRSERIIRDRSSRDTYRSQYAEVMGELDKWLELVPEWKSLFLAGHFREVLDKVTKQWVAFDLELTGTKELVAKGETTLELKMDSLKVAVAELETKRASYKVLLDDYNGLVTERKKLFDGRSADEVEGTFVDREKRLAKVLQSLKGDKEKIVSKKDKVEGIISQIKENIEKNTGQQEVALRVVTSWLEAKDGAFTLADLADLLAKDMAWVTAEREALKLLDMHRTTANATLTERREKLAAHLKKEGKPSEEESEEGLTKGLNECGAAIVATRAREGEVLRLLKNQQENVKKGVLYRSEEAKKGLAADNWAKLNQLFGSSTGAKFKVLAQGYTLDVLLAYANEHLKELTKRYTLQRIGDSLGLQVSDLDMLGEVRTVHSLSGGESFLISLALALGLSSLSSNRMKVESLFIDEGFGSLDGDTLRVALDALERLQTQGRKIGVISHVVEMTERIATQIQVVKAANGRSRIELVG